MGTSSEIKEALTPFDDRASWFVVVVSVPDEKSATLLAIQDGVMSGAQETSLAG